MTGTPGGTGSSQGGQVGWDEELNVQPIPPSNEGTTTVGEMAAMSTTTTQTTEESTDPADQENFGLPEGVTTKASRGELPEAEEPQEEPLLTVEEQMQGGTDEQLEARSPEAIAEAARQRAEAAKASVQASAASAKQARSSQPKPAPKPEKAEA
jgi:hypothetical protein